MWDNQPDIPLSYYRYQIEFEESWQAVCLVQGSLYILRGHSESLEIEDQGELKWFLLKFGNHGTSVDKCG